jgi:hypothetical protein
MPFKLPISGVAPLITDGKITNELLLQEIQKQLNLFLDY